MSSATGTISPKALPLDPKVSAHSCNECGAGFKRLEHLKRHVTSLHEVDRPKPYRCRSCEKGFARSDALVRHVQTCRAAKDGIYTIQQSSTSGLPSPITEPSPFDPSGNVGASMSDFSNEAIAETIVVDNHFGPSASSPQGVSRNFQAEVEDLDGLTNHLVNDDCHVQGLPPIDAAADDDSRPKPGTKIRKRRGRYVPHACVNCRMRKVKCSGDAKCVQCREAGFPCAYGRGRQRRALKASKPDGTASATVHVSLPTNAASGNDDGLSNTLLQMMDRIDSLERNCTMLKSQIAIRSDDGENGDPSASDVEDDASIGSGSDLTSFTSEEAFHGATSLLEPIQILDRTLVVEDGEQHNSRADSPAAEDTPITWHNLPRTNNKAIDVLEKETRLNIEAVRRSVDTFFLSLNPHYPCLNENEFREQFENFLAGNSAYQPKNANRHQFLAMLNLIHAEVTVLSDDWPDSTIAPAWNEFCRAETILDQLTWLGSGNLMTIQCLLLKARYLLYVEKADGAYDTMGKVVRLGWRLGLHDQKSWEARSPFEIVMRQRIFWTIFYLERNISFNCGAPYLIRESDFRVDLPPNLDDKLMYPDQPLPTMETPERSSGPYLGAAAKWGKLCAEIWDAMFGVNAQKPPSQELVAMMDARIKFTTSQFPPHLQWQDNVHRLGGNTDVPSYILRQTAILHLRMNQLRLLLRQQSLLTAAYDGATAKDCVSIATNSIEIIHAQFISPTYRSTDRFSSVLYLIGSLLPLICVIVKGENDGQTCADAIDALTRDLSMLSQMSPYFSVARHTLRRLHRVIQTTRRAISRCHHAEQLMLDLNDFEAETLVPQITDFFNNDYRVDLDMDMLDQTLYGPLMYETSSGLLPGNENVGSQTDYMWTDDEFFRRQRTGLHR